MKRLLLVLAVACIALVGGVSAAFAKGSGGVTAPSIYVNGALYRTVGTPTDFSNTGLRTPASRRSTTSAVCSRTSPKRLRAIPASAADAGRCTRFPSTPATQPRLPRTTRTAAATSTARPRSTRPLPIPVLAALLIWASSSCSSALSFQPTSGTPTGAGRGSAPRPAARRFCPDCDARELGDGYVGQDPIAATRVPTSPARSASPSCSALELSWLVFDLGLIDWPISASRNCVAVISVSNGALGSRGTRKACGACARLRALSPTGKDAGRARDRDAHGSARTGADHARGTR